MNAETKQELTNTLIQDAQEIMKAYPQYNDFYKDYKLVKVKRNIRTKSGLSFQKNDFSIAIPDENNTVCVFSFLTKIDTVIKSEYVDFID